MMRSELEERLGFAVLEEDWDGINTVYTFHPSISDVKGKDEIVKILKKDGKIHSPKRCYYAPTE